MERGDKRKKIVERIREANVTNNRHLYESYRCVHCHDTHPPLVLCITSAADEVNSHDNESRRTGATHILFLLYILCAAHLRTTSDAIIFKFVSSEG